MSPRKVRLVANMIKGMKAKQAEQQLLFINKRSTHPLLGLLRSAIANAHNNFDIPENSDMYVKNIRVNQGPTLKRWQPRAFGRAYTIRKRTSHVLLELEAKEGAIKKEDKKTKPELGKTIKKTSVDQIKPVPTKEEVAAREESPRKQDSKTSFFQPGPLHKKEQLKSAKRRFFQRKSF